MSEPNGRVYDVVHRTTYRYDDRVDTSYGRGYLIPRHGEGQRRLDARVEIDPEPAELREHTDYFGNRSLYFCLPTAHARLDVTARSQVAVSRRPPDRAVLKGLPSVDLRQHLAKAPDGDDPGRMDALLQALQFVLPSPMIGKSAEVAAFAAELGAPGHTLADLLDTLLDRFASDFTYRAGSTDLATTLPELLASRQGVCQDFAHLTVAALRARGLAARYVSGYVETRPPPGQTKLVGADASHAWASVFAPGVGWIDLDPTNHKVVDQDYVVTAVGRDYSDVPPLRGVIFTESTESTMTVSVDMTRVGGSAAGDRPGAEAAPVPGGYLG